jgi:hypothetical protein
MQEGFDVEGFADSLIFSGEATFHLSGKVNRRNVRIWGTENPHVAIQHVRDSPKVNVFCTISKKEVYGSILFAEPTVTGMIYLVENWLMPHLNEDSNNYLFQQDGCPAHYHKDMRGYLNQILPQSE